MAMGGVPHYLKEIEKGKSTTENIDRICFSKQGVLKDEFSQLYPSLFQNADKHILVIRALAQDRQGLTRKKIVEVTKISGGGAIQKILIELQQSGFIAEYHPFKKKKKEKLYRLTDEYCLFYLQFIENKKQIFIVLLTTFGLKHNQYSLGLIDSVLTIDDLFHD